MPRIRAFSISFSWRWDLTASRSILHNQLNHSESVISNSDIKDIPVTNLQHCCPKLFINPAILFVLTFVSAISLIIICN